METIYQQIAQRTGGNIYIGVSGPVRTGKSTLIKRIMEELVIPGIADPRRAERARDELPQSGSGRTIMTSEPKFVPEEAVEISPDGTVKLRVRMIDSVGYMIPGAVGAQEDGAPRMVTTPWFDHEIPLTDAAELGTKKVMAEHCSIGLVLTTDGTITDIPREDYLEAEGKAIRDMQSTGKPYLVVVNSRSPQAAEARNVQDYLAEKYGVDAVVADCQALDGPGITLLLENIMYAFPVGQLRIWLPEWMEALQWDHPVKQLLQRALLEQGEKIHTLLQAEPGLKPLESLEQVEGVDVGDIDLSTGAVDCAVRIPRKFYYEILSDKTGLSIRSDGDLMENLIALSAVKADYDKISDALCAVRATGYGVVMPTAEEMTLETPEVLRKNGSFGVKLKAGAPSIHMIRVDIDTEIQPMVGGEQQSRELVACLTGEDPEKLWQSNIFGKSVYELIREGLNGKVLRLPEDVREKFRGTLSKIVNDGATGLICLIL